MNCRFNCIFDTFEKIRQCLSESRFHLMVYKHFINSYILEFTTNYFVPKTYSFVGACLKRRHVYEALLIFLSYYISNYSCLPIIGRPVRPRGKNPQTPSNAECFMFVGQIKPLCGYCTSSEELWGGKKRKRNIFYLACVGIKVKERSNALCFTAVRFWDQYILSGWKKTVTDK